MFFALSRYEKIWLKFITVNVWAFVQVDFSILIGNQIKFFFLVERSHDDNRQINVDRNEHFK